jgi:hypothetical protein
MLQESEIVIHIEWDGPYALSNAKALTGPADYGVYQIYGGHPIYGNTALLYIGLAAAQHFGERIPQEAQWLDNRDAGRVEVYVGRLSGTTTPNDETWDKHIRAAERLLIFAHSPPMNTQKSLAKLEPDLRNVRILNWAKHRDLMPEVSGSRWTSRYNNIPGYHQFSDEEVPTSSR